MKINLVPKKAVSFLLALVITLTLLPAVSIPAQAAVNWSSGSPSVPKLGKKEIVQLLADSPMTLPDIIYQTKPSVSSPYSAGSINPEALEATVNRLNALRKLAGLPSVVLDEQLCEIAQYGATLLCATGNLTHTPTQPSDMDDLFYQRGYAATSTSNLSYGCSLTEAVDAFMWDSDPFNLNTVGHRRWQLNPELGKVGFGICGSYVDEAVFDSSSSCEYDFISWPASGYFPSDVFLFDGAFDGAQDAAWSISLNPRKFGNIANAQVVLTSDYGMKWEFSRECADGYFRIDFGSYGISNCIIFMPRGSFHNTGTYTVTVTGLTYQGEETTLQYQVELFNAEQLAAGRVACPTLDGTIYFDPTTGTIEGGDNSMIFLDVPSAIGGYPVTAIGRRAFEDGYRLTTVWLPTGVTTIGNYAFRKCDGLREIYLPDTLEYVGYGAFDWCSDLETIHYAGTKEQWEKITVSNENFDFEYAIVEFNVDYPSADPVDVDIPKCDHQTELRNQKDASCVENGYTGDQVCTICGEIVEKGEVIKASGHSYGTEWKNDDTNHWRECTCGEKTDVAAHTYGEWTVSVAQNYETAGEKAQLCSRCNAKNTCPIPSVKDHILTQDIQTDTLNGTPVNKMTVSSGVAVLLASYSTQGQMQTIEVLAEGDGSVDECTTIYFSLPKNANLTNRMFFLKPGYIPLCFRGVSEAR